MRNEAFSKSALDLINTVSTLGGYNREDVVMRCVRRTTKQCSVRTVLNVLDEMLAEQKGDSETST